MTSRSGIRSVVNRQPGERADAFRARAQAVHRAEALQEKIAAGRWLSPEEYARRTGRPGRILPPTEARIAEEARIAAAAAPQTKAAVARPVAGVVVRDRLGEQARVLGNDFFVGTALSIMGEVVRDGRSVKLSAAAQRGVRAGAEGAVRSAAQRGVAEMIDRGLVSLGGAASREVAAAGVREGSRAVVREGASAAARSALRSNAVGAAAGFLVDQGVDTVRLLAGSIDGAEYGRRSLENGASSGGGLGGAAAGAALGTALFPGVGTAVGGIVGGILGSLGGSALAKSFTR